MLILPLYKLHICIAVFSNSVTLEESDSVQTSTAVCSPLSVRFVALIAPCPSQD